MGKSGRVAIFFRNGTRFSAVQLGRECESITINICAGKYELAIINYYKPCNLSIDILNMVLGEVQGKAVWCRDFNAHSTQWGSERTDENGSLVEEFIEDKGLVCMNEGRGTRYDCVQNREDRKKSLTDLTMSSNEIAGITAWEVLN